MTLLSGYRLTQDIVHWILNVGSAHRFGSIIFPFSGQMEISWSFLPADLIYPLHDSWREYIVHRSSCWFSNCTRACTTFTNNARFLCTIARRDNLILRVKRSMFSFLYVRFLIPLQSLLSSEYSRLNTRIHILCNIIIYEWIN